MICYGCFLISERLHNMRQLQCVSENKPQNVFVYYFQSQLLSFSLFSFFFSSGDKVSWSQALASNSLMKLPLLILLLPFLKCYDRHTPPHLILFSAADQTKSVLHAKRDLYQLRHTLPPHPSQFPIKHFSVRDQTCLTDALVPGEIRCDGSPTCLAILPELVLDSSALQYQGALSHQVKLYHP